MMSSEFFYIAHVVLSTGATMAGFFTSKLIYLFAQLTTDKPIM